MKNTKLASLILMTLSISVGLFFISIKASAEACAKATSFCVLPDTLVESEQQVDGYHVFTDKACAGMKYLSVRRQTCGQHTDLMRICEKNSGIFEIPTQVQTRSFKKYICSVN